MGNVLGAGQGQNVARQAMIRAEIAKETSAEKMGRLRAAFKKDGTVTAGNASGINDAAAALLAILTTSN